MNSYSKINWNLFYGKIMTNEFTLCIQGAPGVWEETLESHKWKILKCDVTWYALDFNNFISLSDVSRLFTWQLPGNEKAFVAMALLANHFDLEIASFLKVTRSFIYKDRNELEILMM